MREITKSVSRIFESEAIENALKLGIRNLVVFGKKTYCREYKSITLFVSESYEDFCGSFEREGIKLRKDKPIICSFLHEDYSKENVQAVIIRLREFPEGTTVIFTHNDDMSDTEKMLSISGFRTIEHFSADKVADAFGLFKKSSENTFYCLCVKK